MDPLLYVLLAVAGVAAGVVNTLAGGGSMITLPLLMSVGLPATVANGTNRVAILVQNVFATWGFKRKGALDLRAAARMIVPITLGALAGAWTGVRVEPDHLRRIFGFVLIVLVVVVLVRPRRWIEGRGADKRPMPPLVTFGLCLVTGFWGGFAQVGVGFLFLATMVLGGGWDLVRANAIKVMLILIYTILALVIYFGHGQVDMMAGGALAVGNGAGGWLASHLAVAKGAAWVRWVLIAAALAGAVRMLVWA